MKEFFNNIKTQIAIMDGLLFYALLSLLCIVACMLLINMIQNIQGKRCVVCAIFTNKVVKESLRFTTLIAIYSGVSIKGAGGIPLANTTGGIGI